MEVKNNDKINILVVDDDTTCLLITAASFRNSKFEVMTAKSAKVALTVLRSSGLSFDFVLIDVHMPEMDGFQLQQEIIKEFDIPIGVMSVDEKESTVKKGLDNGAVFFILKPVTQDNIHYLWEYATSLQKKKHTSKQVVNQEFQANTDEIILIESSSSDSERDKSTRKYYETENEGSSYQPPMKSRIIWTPFLHNKFVEAFETLDVKKANPKKVQELMNIPELTRRQISSHLQKYRISLEKNARPELIPDSSKTTSGTANQLSTRKAAGNISTLGQQLMTGNLNDAGHDIEVDLQHFQTVQKDKESAEILTRHINQKTSNVQENYEDITAEKRPFHLGNVLPNWEFEQENYGAEAFHLQCDLPNWKLEQGNYEGVTADETLFQDHYFPSNSELGDYRSFTAEECSFLRNVLLDYELEEENHGVAIEEESLQLRNDSSNSKLEQENHGGVTTEEGSLQLRNDSSNSKLEVVPHIPMFDKSALYFKI